MIAAAQAGNSSVVEKLVKAGAIVDERDTRGRTALIYAAQNGSVNIVKILLAAGASTTLRDDRGHNALRLSVEKRHSDIVRLLIESTNKELGGIPPDIMIRAGYGAADVLAQLIAIGGDVNARDHKGATPLWHAAGVSEINTRLLISAGADVEAQDNQETTVLIHAALFHKPECVKLLLDAGAKVDVVNKDNDTPLSAAVRHAVGKSDNTMMELLLKAGADVNYDKGHFALTQAVRTSYLSKDYSDARVSAILFLISAGADVNHKSSYHEETPLMTAAAYGHYKCVQVLIENGADVNAKQRYHGTTALMDAITCTVPEQKERILTVQALLRGGADPNIKDKDGETALMKASNRNYKPIVEILQNAVNAKSI